MDLGAFLNHTDGLPRATTLFQGSGLRGLLLHLNAGEQIPEHQTRGAITVHCLQGEATFGSGEEQVTLDLSGLIHRLGIVKRTDDLSSLSISRNQKAARCHRSRLLPFSVPELSANFQRANRHTLQLSGNAHRHCVSGRAVPVAV
jgi:hypothetical protein